MLPSPSYKTNYCECALRRFRGMLASVRAMAKSSLVNGWQGISIFVSCLKSKAKLGPNRNGCRRGMSNVADLHEVYFSRWFAPATHNRRHRGHPAVPTLCVHFQFNLHDRAIKIDHISRSPPKVSFGSNVAELHLGYGKIAHRCVLCTCHDSIHENTRGGGYLLLTMGSCLVRGTSCAHPLQIMRTFCIRSHSRPTGPRGRSGDANSAWARRVSAIPDGPSNENDEVCTQHSGGCQKQLIGVI